MLRDYEDQAGHSVMRMVEEEVNQEVRKEAPMRGAEEVDPPGVTDLPEDQEHQGDVQSRLINQPVSQVFQLTRHTHKQLDQNRIGDRRLGECYVAQEKGI